MLKLRRYCSDDGSALLDLFRDTIRRVNCRDYNPQQISAWASDDIDVIEWCQRFQGRYVVVAELDEQLAGFAELEGTGHVDRFYVAADYIGRGVGRAMLVDLVEEAKRQDLTTLRVEASITARPFFESHGFEAITRQLVTCRSVQLANYVMKRQI